MVRPPRAHTHRPLPAPCTCCVLRVPLRFVDAGLNQTLRRGAYLHRVRHALGVRCADAASVPEALEVSCAAGSWSGGPVDSLKAHGAT